MTTRRLAAILAADMVGFSSLMGQDEEGTLARIKSLRGEVIEPSAPRMRLTSGDFPEVSQRSVDAIGSPGRW
jgi:class 3 adenylate cyclase